MRDALRLVEELKHPATTAIALWFSHWVHYQPGEGEAAAAARDRMLALCSEHGLVGAMAAADLLPRARTGEGLGAKAIPELPGRLVSAWAGGAIWRRVFSVCAFAERCAEAGHVEPGQEALATSSEENRSAFYAPEIHRLEGELLLRRSAPASGDAEQCVRRAIDLARGEPRRRRR